jgi:hypothetical protein
MMLAMGFETDVLEDHHIVIAFDLLEGAGEIVFGVLAITGEPVLERLGDAGGGVLQAFT